MSYGMMISVQLNHRDVFDKLWRWSKKYMAYPKGSEWDGYFCWQCKPDGTKIGTSNASDGEIYYVAALGRDASHGEMALLSGHGLLPLNVARIG